MFQILSERRTATLLTALFLVCFTLMSLSARRSGGATLFEEVALSRTGKIWSYTTNHYKPPAPYMPPDPFVPYTIAAVELDREKMVVLGQVASDVGPDELATGIEVELVLETLYEDDDSEFLVWKWKPVAS